MQKTSGRLFRKPSSQINPLTRINLMSWPTREHNVRPNHRDMISTYILEMSNGRNYIIPLSGRGLCAVHPIDLRRVCRRRRLSKSPRSSLSFAWIHCIPFVRLLLTRARHGAIIITLKVQKWTIKVDTFDNTMDGGGLERDGCFALREVHMQVMHKGPVSIRYSTLKATLPGDESQRQWAVCSRLTGRGHNDWKTI